MKHWIAAALAVVGVALGTSACGSEDNGGVVEAPATTRAPSQPGDTKGYDYSN